MDLDAVTYAAKSAKEWTGRRDRRIREAITAGASLRSVAEAAGLSHAGVRKIATRPEKAT